MPHQSAAYQCVISNQLILTPVRSINGVGDRKLATEPVRMGISEALILLALLTLKHMFADYFLQTASMLANRGQYVHPGRIMHCAVHAGCSAICFLIMGLPLGLSLAVLLAEFVAHFHIDWGKGRWSEMQGHTPSDAGYWRAFGADQALHHLTYVLMVAAFV